MKFPKHKKPKHRSSGTEYGSGNIFANVLSKQVDLVEIWVGLFALCFFNIELAEDIGGSYGT